MSVMGKVGRRILRDLGAGAWRRTARGVEDTPPTGTARLPVTVLSMVGTREVDAYLVAVKSFHRYLPARVEALDDGSLTADDRRRLARHVPGITISTYADVPADRCQSGGCWERLYRIAALNRDQYVIQLDSDTVTPSEPTEVLAAVEAMRGFVIGGGLEGSALVDYATAAAAAAPQPPGHMQRDAEIALPHLAFGGHYVRGCAAFCGFPPGSVTRDAIEAIHGVMVRHLGARWSEWGSEQVASNILVANAAGTTVLPAPRYCSHYPESYHLVRDPGVALVHFIGPHRYDRGNYRALARGAITALARRNRPA
jgi:hypothetical protein